MPRSGGVYSLPSGSTITNGDTSDATDINTPLSDLEADMNTARPIIAGGTGSTSASGARTALGLAIGTDVQAYNATLATISSQSGVDTAELVADAVTTAKIAAGAVGTSDIASSAVTAGKIGSNAVTAAKIAAGAVDTSELAANAVTTAKLDETDSYTVVSVTATGGNSSFTNAAGIPITANRTGDDGVLVRFEQGGSLEGSISVSGTTVSYNGFAGSHWSRLADNTRPDIPVGTVMDAIDEMVDWYSVEDNAGPRPRRREVAKGRPGAVRETDFKHVKSEVSASPGSRAVYGVFGGWDSDAAEDVNDFYVVAMGSHPVRVSGAVSRGDLLESAGDGTARVQADDIVRASTVAKVLSSAPQHQFPDGSYTVPASLLCG